MTEKRVYWSDDEKRELIDSVFVMRQTDPDSSLIAIINRVQEQFPPDRQRNIPSVKVIPWLSEQLRERFAEMRRKASALANAKTEVTTVKQGQQALKERLNELVKKAREEAIGKMSTEDLAFELLSRMDANQQELHSRMNELEREVTTLKSARHMVNQVTGTTIRLPNATMTPAPKPKTILVIGMLQEQANNLIKKFKGRAGLRFMRGDDVRSTFPQVDHVILNGKFTAHKVQARVKSQIGELLEIVSGGQSIVAQKIEEIINRG